MPDRQFFRHTAAECPRRGNRRRPLNCVVPDRNKFASACFLLLTFRFPCLIIVVTFKALDRWTGGNIMATYCQYCGSEILDNVRYCPHCGASLINGTFNGSTASTGEAASSTMRTAAKIGGVVLGASALNSLARRLSHRRRPMYYSRPMGGPPPMDRPMGGPPPMGGPMGGPPPMGGPMGGGPMGGPGGTGGRGGRW